MGPTIIADEDDWLRPQLVTCPSCQTSVYRVDHSPMIDAWCVYCDQCPRFADVSFYDPIVGELRKLAASSQELLAAIEKRLRACDCGGAFSFMAPRRCFECGAVITTEIGVDLYPGFVFDHRDRAPTDEEQARFDAFLRDFARETDLWR